MTTRVLCIDDEPDIIVLVRAMLSPNKAWVVDGAGSMAEGAAAFSSQPADVVLLDVDLPDVVDDPLDGLREVLAWRPQPAIVMLTGTQDRLLGLRAVDAGAQDYLEKSTINPARLAHALDFARRRSTAHTRTAIRAAVAVERAEALSAYAGTVSHDLRSPIGTLMMLAQSTETTIAHHAGDPALALERLRPVAASMTNLARRALRYCDELLEDAQRASSQREAVDLLGLVSDAAQLALADDPLGLSIEVGELPDGLWGQTASLRQVLVNLMMNASRHTPRPGGRISIHARIDEKRCIIVVEDNGPGVPAEDRAKVFADGTSGAGSTGFGLAAVERVMDRHGGRVWIEDSERLGGAAFLLELPWRSPRDDEADDNGHDDNGNDDA